jgi:single-stranded-DNA-specific exonuclease
MHRISESPSLGEAPGVQWKLKPAQGDFVRLAQQLNIHPVAARILVSRGIDSPAAAHRFLNPGWDDILDPQDLPNMGGAVSRIVRAIRQQEQILVFCDYDVDGVVATAILAHAIAARGRQRELESAASAC